MTLYEDLPPSKRLKPEAAAAAIIVNSNGHLLLQLRDNKPDIFFPNHWGCFGGAIDANEGPSESVTRELEEEIGLQVNIGKSDQFTKFTFDLFGLGLGSIDRNYFIIDIGQKPITSLELNEGSEMRFFHQTEISMLQMVPYDRFAIWLYNNKCYLE